MTFIESGGATFFGHGPASGRIKEGKGGEGGGPDQEGFGVERDCYLFSKEDSHDDNRFETFIDVRTLHASILSYLISASGKRNVSFHPCSAMHALVLAPAALCLESRN